MNRPIESDYVSQVAYTRALEEYCNALEQPAQEPVGYVREGRLSIDEARKILDAALDLEKSGREISIYRTMTDDEKLNTGQEYSDMVARNRSIELYLRDLLKILTNPQCEPCKWEEIRPGIGRWIPLEANDCGPVARVNADGFIVELNGISLSPGILLSIYTIPSTAQPAQELNK